MRAHTMHVYSTEAEWQQAVVGFLAEGVQAGDGVVAIADPTHLQTLRGRMSPLTLVDADQALARFMRAGRPDPRLFEEVANAALDQAEDRSETGRVRAFGEMVQVLAQRGQWEAAVALEDLWNALAARRHFALFCAYSSHSFASDCEPLFEVVARQHGHVTPTSWRLGALRRAGLAPAAALAP